MNTTKPTEQPALINDIEVEDVGVLFSREEMEKRYTAKQMDKLERLRNAVFMLIPAWPVEDIARNLGMSTRTVRACAALYAEKVAGSKRDFTKVLRSTAARWLALARTREHEATFQQLAIGLGIILDKARDLDLTGSVEEENVVKEDRDRVQAAAELRALMEGGADPGGAGDGAVDSASSEESLIDKHLRHDDGKSIDHDAGGGQLVQAAGDRPSAQAVATGREGGGGVGGLDASKYPMGSRDGDMQANGSSDAWDGRCEHGVPYKQCGSCFDIPEAVVQKNARRAQEGGGVA